MSNRAFEPLIPNAWYLAAWSRELDGKLLTRQLLNQDVVLFRDADGKAAALEDRCPHRAAPLSRGTLVEAGLQCGYHGMTFDCSGRCTVNPGEDVGNFRVQSYPIVERQQFIWIWMGNPTLADPANIIDFPYHDQPEEWPFQFARYHLECSYVLMIDNLMDLTHLGYVHGKTIGGTPRVHVEATQETTETDRGVHMVRWMLDCPPPPTFVKAMSFEGNVDRWSDFEYVAPGSILQFGGALDTGRGAQADQNQKGALRVRLYHGLTPETDTTCHYFWSTGNGYRQDDPQAARDLHGDAASAFLEDKAMLEAQQRTMSRHPDRALFVREHDRALVLAHGALDRLAEVAADK